MKKIVILPALILIFSGAALFGVFRVEAQTNTDPHTSIIQRLVQKFGLKEADIRAVFEEEKNARQTEMRARFEEKLSQAVKDSELTEAQKQLIIAKLNELKTKHEQDKNQFQNMTPQQRRIAIQNQRKEFETWAKTNGIDLSYFKTGLKGRMKHW